MPLNIPGLLGALADLPGVINQGLLGPLPMNPGIEQMLGQQGGQARQMASNDFASSLASGAGLGASRDYARQGYSGRIFDALKEQELLRMGESRKTDEARQARLAKEFPQLANLSPEIREQVIGKLIAAEQAQVSPDIQARLEADLEERAKQHEYDMELAAARNAGGGGAGGGAPAAVEEYNFYRNLPEAEKAEFLRVKRMNATPQIAQDIAAGRARGAVQGETAGNLPNIEFKAQTALDTLDALEKSPGFNNIFGLASVVPIIPGTEQANTYALWEQTQGQAFLSAYETLKGGGQITEIEGQKATAAITSLAQRKQKPAAARKAITTLRGIIKTGLDRAKQKAGQAPAAPAGLPAVGEVRKGYRFKGGDPSKPESWEKQ
jgi:hypothetical protein